MKRLTLLLFLVLPSICLAGRVILVPLDEIWDLESKIVGAFGQKLGAVVDEKLEFVLKFDNPTLNVFINHDALKYRFKPEKPYPAFTDYFVLSTPVSKTIYEIIMTGGAKPCSREKKILGAVLEQKYPYLEHTVHRPTGDITSRQDDKIRWIYLSCDHNGLIMIYTDSDLEKLVIEELASQVDKSNF